MTDKAYFDEIKEKLFKRCYTKRSKNNAQQHFDSVKSYILEQYDKVEQYKKDVRSGKIKACVWLKMGIEREEKLRKKYHYDKYKVYDFFKFTYYVNIVHKGKRVRFEPSPWQCWIIDSIFGLFRENDSVKRLRKYAIIWVGRKSGKTSLAAVMALYSFMMEEMDSESYFAATTKEQASQALKYIKQMVRTSPTISNMVDVLQHSLRYNRSDGSENIAKAVANEPDKLDGLNPSFAIIDESHAMPDKEMYNIMKTGTMARTNPLIIQISTSGKNKDFPFYNDLEVGKKVLEGNIDDDQTFYGFYTLDDGDDFEDVEQWEKANPAVNVIIDINDLVDAWEKAKLFLTDKKNFIIKNLNVYQEGEDQWIPDEDYDVVDNPIDLHSLKGKKAYMGIDLSKSRDLSSIALVVLGDDDRFKVITEFFFPTDEGIVQKVRKNDPDFSQWIEDGFIQQHDNRIVDYDEVFDRIAFWADFFDLQAIGYDKFNAQQLITKIDSDLAVDLFECAQNATFFNNPLKLIERLIFSDGIDMGQNPVLRWNFRNIVLYEDDNANIKIAKKKSLDSVDGAVALGMAMGMWLEHNFDMANVLLERYTKKKELLTKDKEDD